ncbi:FtsB family cell division protein [Lederbergia citrea]|uniref:Septum formation initiator family protein n=1 Tax=Lederbergia citrea TaxID=2833581 RepID=A0A942UQM0_9BACI|nr:septum formation initiator family protein [Lederbergia citrea]MBS4179721.1 septum formation initiator family protein [Lederbergia citrea]MBS4206430.1 septum formation initiator family protein [Lederbergia citrea]MBS4225050.1 septum formation initiator family protein [Lederbergia citrea]
MPIASLETNYMKQQEVAMKRAVKRRKLLLRRLSVFLILTVALSYLVISTLVFRSSILESKQEEKVKLEETLAKLEKKQAMLENEIVKLNDDEYIAKLARSEYFLSDKGEVIFNIPDPKKKKEEEMSY